MNMKPTGVIRRVDDLGRVVIPRELRKQQGIVDGTPMDISITEDGSIVFKRHSHSEALLPLCLAMRTQLNENYTEIADDVGEETVKKIQTQLNDIYTQLKKK